MRFEKCQFPVILNLLLTYILTRPIQNLLLATNQISEGKFDFRARIFSGDEIGKLAVAFNKMADSLQMFRQEVKEKEAIRQALIEKIVLKHCTRLARPIGSITFCAPFGNTINA